GRPQTYWWPLPAGTTLAPGGYLLVHWYQDPPAAPPPNELWTGTSLWQFLFSLGGEPLPTRAGALAPLDSQQDALVNSASGFGGLVQYGGSGLPREALAVAAQLWTAGVALPAPAPGQLLARNPQLVGQLPPEQQWLLDGSPTPLGANVGPAAVA